MKVFILSRFHPRVQEWKAWFKKKPQQNLSFHTRIFISHVYLCMHVSFGMYNDMILHLFPAACSHFLVFLHLCLHSVIFRYRCVFYLFHSPRKKILFLSSAFSYFLRCKCKTYASAIRDIMFEAFPFFSGAVEASCNS